MSELPSSVRLNEQEIKLIVLLRTIEWGKVTVAKEQGKYVRPIKIETNHDI